MKIKRYEGKSETEVMEKIKQELGKDALILNVRRIEPSGFMKFFKAPLVEVTATNDKLFTRPIKRSEENNDDTNTEKQVTYTNRFIPKEQPQKNIEKEKDNNQESIKKLEDKIDNLELILKSVSDKLATVENTSENKYKNNILQLFYDNMIKNEVTPEVAKQVLDGLDETDEKSNVNEMVRLVYNKISSMLGKPEDIKIEKNDKKPKVVAFVGPTGVGKTTTIAKIVAKFVLDNKKKVSLITADTYRIAAVEQLKTYAQILGCPIEVVYNSSLCW